MPKRTRKIPRGVGSFTPLDLISDVDWQRIETGYERKLSDDVREEIFRATQNYVLFESTERNAEPDNDAKKWMRGVQKTTANLQQMMDSNSTSYAALLIESHFEDTSLSDKWAGIYVGRFRSLKSVLGSFGLACEMALRDLAAAASTRGLLGDLRALPSWVEGAEWQKWIRKLTRPPLGLAALA